MIYFSYHDQLEELFIVLFSFAYSQHVYFLTNFKFATATYFSRARHSLFVRKMALNRNQSILQSVKKSIKFFEDCGVIEINRIKVFKRRVSSRIRMCHRLCDFFVDSVSSPGLFQIHGSLNHFVFLLLTLTALNLSLPSFFTDRAPQIPCLHFSQLFDYLNIRLTISDSKAFRAVPEPYTKFASNNEEIRGSSCMLLLLFLVLSY